jgi:hypothetical protein
VFIIGSLKRTKHSALKAISKQNSKQYFRIKRKLYAHSYLPRGFEGLMRENRSYREKVTRRMTGNIRHSP